MKIRRLIGAFAFGCAAAFVAMAVTGSAVAQEDASKGIEQYRKMMADDPFANPGNLYIDSGEALWKEKRGSKNVSLEGCDMGKGPGVLEGAFAELPRYFADADKVMDMESRILWCMENLQGLDTGPVKKGAFSKRGQGGSEMEFLASYVGSLSNGMKLTPQLSHAKEKEAYDIGEALFYRHAGPHDFSCQTCHGASGTRIRLQELPDLAKPGPDAQSTIATWPAYRVSAESVKTMQHRMADCYRQMRMPRVGFGSDAVTALIVYLVKQGEGGVIQVPALKR
ncbi:MAG TPA: sulfur oxidation c-type cytochrome SoxA [Hyphomicrobiaceae bacterium]|nr:sulfur oxidation c-type cytochrome SoxA [Hyphomicrobiaceae bacterium]